jgi:hypothetical protein
LTAFSGLLVARYQQIDISIERMTRLMEGVPLEMLVKSSSVHLDKSPDVLCLWRGDVA